METHHGNTGPGGIAGRHRVALARMSGGLLPAARRHFCSRENQRCDKRHPQVHRRQLGKDFSRIPRGYGEGDLPGRGRHTVPSTDPSMWLFFYWDTYFTNLDCCARGGSTQALQQCGERDLSDRTPGISCPNISVKIALNRSQTPVSAVLFSEIYQHSRDKAWLARAYAALVKETPSGWRCDWPPTG